MVVFRFTGYKGGHMICFKITWTHLKSHGTMASMPSVSHLLLDVWGKFQAACLVRGRRVSEALALRPRTWLRALLRHSDYLRRML